MRLFWAVPFFILALIGCAPTPEQLGPREPVSVTLVADAETRILTSEGTNVRELLAEAGISLADSDEVMPPLFTPLSDGLRITVARISESVENLEQIIPFDRKIVRNEAMDADAEPLIVQGGRPGLQEITVRIIYRDGLEVDRQVTRVTVIEPAQDEILMIGIGTAAGNLTFAGTLAFISGGNSVILRGNSAFPEQLNTGSNLDQRVFTLSPDGRNLLYTRTTTETTSFNRLWVISTERGAEPRSLGVENVLWAGWNPARVEQPQIAFSTGIPVETLPGWEANNDLWLGNLPLNSAAANGAPFNPDQLIEGYPATYGWWGGYYAWSPDGRALAYSFADEIGVIDLNNGNEHRRLQRFPEYNTRAAWVWTPSLSWSPDGRYLVFTAHRGDNGESEGFDTVAIDTVTGVSGRFLEQTGMWSHAHWSPPQAAPFRPAADVSQIAFLRATNPFDSQRSSYTLWLMDRDGSNPRQVYPPAGENSRFPFEQQFMAWSANGRDIAFVYNDALYILNLDTGQARRITQDDNIARNPTWAPYGPTAPATLPATEPRPIPTPAAPSRDLLPEEQLFEEPWLRELMP
jgi:resuscitation-promoting factor RpfB